MKSRYVVIFFLFLSKNIFAQINPPIIGTFPNSITESSGLELRDSNSLWTMNDSGGTNTVYGVNYKGEIIDSLVIENATNVDWEDLGKADNGRLFIGDIGNNSEGRTDLRIYIVNPDTLTNNNRNLKAEIINFHYPDQKEFPASKQNKNFNAESLFYLNDSLYIISKNTSTNGSGYGKLYRLPANGGNYTAALIDSFYFNEPVTAADISPDKNTLVVLGYLSVFVFTNFSNHHFFEGTLLKKTFTAVTQKEAVVFSNNHHLYLSDEKSNGVGGKLYEYDLDQFLTAGNDKTIMGRFFFVYPNPCTGKFFISNCDNTTGDGIITIKSFIGQTVMQTKLMNEVDVSSLSKGIYCISITDNKELFNQTFIVQ